MTKDTRSKRTYEAESRNDWLDRLAQFNQHFGRFVRDAFGVLLIAFALMSFLAIGGYTDGVLLTPWAGLISLWLGWGAYLLLLAIGYVGFSLLRRVGTPIPWGRLFILELASFLTLGLFAVLGGNSVLDAEAGLFGGRIGWGVTTLFWRIGKLWGTILLFALWLLAVMSGFNLWAWVERWLLKVSGEAPPVETVIHPLVPDEAPVEAKEESKERAASKVQSVAARVS